MYSLIKQCKFILLLLECFMVTMLFILYRSHVHSLCTSEDRTNATIVIAFVCHGFYMVRVTSALKETIRNNMQS